jgi:hypothetical protein
MNVSPDYRIVVNLELKLRQSAGDEFQDFFSKVMQKKHGDDFVRVRPFGQKGDKGCDGHLQSSGAVYQCYGALNGDKGKVDYLIGKMADDFATAKAKLGALMKGWYMVHNLVDGLPIDAVQAMDELKKANPTLEFGFVGLESFSQTIAKLPDSQIEELLGPTATNKDGQELQVPALRDLIKGIVEGTSGKSSPTIASIQPVPADKLDANDLPLHWRQLVANGWQNAHLVGDYFDRHPDPMTGETVASMFKERYQYLKAQNLPPASIMDSLYVFITGAGTVAPVRQVAAQALLAYLFESCDIFENVSAGAAG